MHCELSVTLEATVAANSTTSARTIYPGTELLSSYGSNEMENATLFGMELSVIV